MLDELRLTIWLHREAWRAAAISVQLDNPYWHGRQAQAAMRHWMRIERAITQAQQEVDQAEMLRLLKRQQG